MKMKKTTLQFKTAQPKHRAHRPLFEEDSPFKPKVVKRKDLYKRKPKYKNHIDTDE